jgi:hypothetical protein
MVKMTGMNGMYKINHVCFDFRTWHTSSLALTHRDVSVLSSEYGMKFSEIQAATPSSSCVLIRNVGEILGEGYNARAVCPTVRTA